VPDEEWGERVHAVVQPVPGATLEPADVIAHCRAHLGGYQVPRSAELVDDLPRTETGKLARRLIRDRFWEGRPRRI
jgi:long-chain acyl-CoA synthetase